MDLPNKAHSQTHQPRSHRRKKHYSDTSDTSVSSDTSDGSYTSDSSFDEKVERSVDKLMLPLLKSTDIRGYPYEEYRPALNGITHQMSRDDALCKMHSEYLGGREERFDVAIRMSGERYDKNLKRKKRAEKNLKRKKRAEKKKRKNKSRGTDDRRGNKYERYKKKRKKKR